jgi:hypothetical protein
VYTLSIYDLLGKEVFWSTYELGPYSGSIFLEDLSYLENGVYMLRINGEGLSFSGKLIAND